MCVACDSITREKREEAIHRHYDGEAATQTALRYGTKRGCISGWVRDWDCRAGLWTGQPLTAYELSRGWHVVRDKNFDLDNPYWQWRVKGTKRKLPKTKPKSVFLRKITVGKEMLVDEFRDAYSALPDDERARYAVAYDVMVEALDLEQLGKAKRKQAAEMAALELREEAA